jgi:hypothetical protein
MSQLTVTLPESIRLQAETVAEREGVPLDTFVACAVAEKVAVLEAGRVLRERAARGHWEDFAAILAKVPDVEPEEYDRLSPEAAAAFEEIKKRHSPASAA